MNIGDYVRTKDYGIAKIIDSRITKKGGDIYCTVQTVYTTYITDNNLYLNDGDIIKSSSNIIDLIEVGDYVNGMLVTNIWIDKETGNIEFEFNNHESYLYPKSWNYESRVTKYKIKSIVIKEQFENIEYKIESEVN